jgi:L-asparaginase II
MAARDFPANPVLVRIRRGGRTESQHRGAFAAVREGRVVAARGDVEVPVFVRSAAKPFQVLPLLETGAADRFGVTARELVLAAASHDGRDEHERVARDLLARGGFEEADLRCGSHPSLDPEVAASLAEAGVCPTPLRNNCSGKHAAFLLLGRHLGEPKERYLDPEGAAQRAVREAVASACGLPSEEIACATDGCSAPTFALPLVGLALGFERFATPDGFDPPRARAASRVMEAVRAHPEMVAGERRLDTRLLRATGGRIFAKVGAEGIHAAGVVGGRVGIALKIDDGGSRARAPLLLALLRALDLLSPVELESLGPPADRVLRNHAGLPVGEVEVSL